MSFNISRIVIKNRAPFVDDLDLCFESNGVTVLTAVNGKGKTTLLSYIVDAWVEMTRSAYRSSYIGKENRYYRISSSLFSIDSSKPSMVYIRFNNNGNNIDYIDLRNYCSQGEYEMLTNGLGCLVGYALIKDKLEQDGYIKYLSSQDYKEIRSIWNNNIVTYFPSYRHFDPYYLTDYYKEGADYSTLMSYSDVLPNPIESKMDIQRIVNWLMDVVIDSELHRSVIETKKDTLTPEDELWNNVQTIVRKALVSKYPDGDVKLSISRRGWGIQRVSVTNNAEDKTYCPSIYHLSSGEQEVLCLFAEILRQADVLHNNVKLPKITGVVLIDEIDLHLHIRLQKEVLPALMQLFPNVQFVVSSHSPFLNMGLAENEGARNRTIIIDLDNKGIVSSPTTNEVYEDVYKSLIEEKDQYAQEVSDLQSRITVLTKPLVITEGKTDWKHIKRAFAYFKSDITYSDLDFELCEYEIPFGNTKLDSTLKYYSLFPNRFKIIGIFDCDDDLGKSIQKNGGIKEYGNNVYGMCIPIPDHRKDISIGISIEFLYKDADLLKTDNKGRRLFFTSEFDTNGRYKEDPSIIVKNARDVKDYTEISKQKILDHDVIDLSGNNLALSKESFAASIINSVPPFDIVDLSGFKGVFDRLNVIIR